MHWSNGTRNRFVRKFAGGSLQKEGGERQKNSEIETEIETER